MDVLAACVRRGDADSVLPLRNLKVAAFGAQAHALGTAVSEWIGRQMSTSGQPAGMELLKVLNATTRPASTEWLSWVNSGLQSAVPTSTEVVTSRVWWLWEQNENLFEIISPFVPTQGAREAGWLKTAPSTFTRALGLRVMNWSRSCGWWVLHVKTLLSLMPWEAALRAQLAADANKANLEPIRVLFEAEPASSVITLAAGENDERMWECGAERCLSYPEALAHFDVNKQGWREILKRALARLPQLLHRLPNGGRVLFQLVDRLLSGKNDVEDLLVVFGQNGIADLSEYSQLQFALSRLPRSCQGEFIKATTMGWLRRFFAAPTATPNIEPILRQ